MTREAIVRHFNEGHSRRVEVSKSTWQLYVELFTTYRWNLFVGFNKPDSYISEP